MWHRLPALAAAVLLGLSVSAQSPPNNGKTEAAESAHKLRVGVRSEARPFSYKSDTLLDVLTAATPGPLAQRNYTGYMVKICDAVLNEMMIDPRGPDLTSQEIEVVDLDTRLRETAGVKGSRFRFLKPGEGQPEAEIDILCDPATITNERRAGLIISPPVYLTGISYVTRRGEQRSRDQRNEEGCPRPLQQQPDRVQFLFGLVGNTTAANAGIRALLDTGEMPQDREALIRFLRGESDCRNDGQIKNIIDRMEDERQVLASGPVLLFKTHKDAAEAFCNGEIFYYVGDREIVTANAGTIPGCEFDNGNRTFTMDRYAIFGRVDYETDPARALLVARFFEVLSQKILSHPSILDQAFYDTFHPTAPTRTLEIFFRSVRGAPSEL
ncbi:MAG: hypothetical protein AAF729_02045 [Pseudomonadota bacterium]